MLAPLQEPDGSSLLGGLHPQQEQSFPLQPVPKAHNLVPQFPDYTYRQSGNTGNRKLHLDGIPIIPGTLKKAQLFGLISTSWAAPLTLILFSPVARKAHGNVYPKK